ncbi:MAG: PilN domain-containing protein [Fibrobacteres bacterium]|nr:PilN domain-containing protein [Fibrobacterota bacterium]
MASMIEVNLLPMEYRVVRKDYSYLTDRRAVWGSVLLLTFGVLTWLHFMTLVATATSREGQIKDLRRDIAKYDTVKTEIKRLEDIKAKQEAKNISLKNISVSKKRWVRIFEDINASLPSHTWIISIKEEADKQDQLAIQARTFVFQEVAAFMLQLERRPFFLPPNLESIEQVKADGGQNASAFSFTLHCPLNPAIHTDGPAPGDTVGNAH